MLTTRHATYEQRNNEVHSHNPVSYVYTAQTLHHIPFHLITRHFQHNGCYTLNTMDLTHQNGNQLHGWQILSNLAFLWWPWLTAFWGLPLNSGSQTLSHISLIRMLCF